MKHIWYFLVGLFIVVTAPIWLAAFAVCAFVGGLYHMGKFFITGKTDPYHDTGW